MPSTPTTKSQVQAYRFVLRRMQSALVRKDAVMLHDPMRTHTRATTIGVIVACLGLVGFVVFGLFNKSPSAPSKGIVISKQSGAVYVARDDPRQLIPVLNLASARLMLMQEAATGGTSASSGSDPGSFNGEVTVVDDSALQGITRGRLSGIPGAPMLLPERQDQRTSPNWAVCDRLDMQSNLPDAARRANVETTVLGGVPEMKGLRPLGPKDAILAEAPDGRPYLVYPAPPGSGKSGAGAVRARIDTTDPAIVSVFNLRDAKPRRMTAAELNAIPEVRPLAIPKIDGEGTDPTYNAGYNQKVGRVVQAEVAGEAPRFYLLLRDGMQQVSPAVAQLFRVAKSPGQQGIPLITAGQEQAQRTSNPLPVNDFPAELPNVVSASDNPVSCLSWSLRDGDERTQVLLGSQVPVPQGVQPVQLNQPGASGELVKWFYLPPGHAGMVRAAGSKADFGNGPIFLVSDTGVRYGIPDVATATALGVNTNNGAFDPAPESILRLLPSGPSLNHNDALRTFDTLPVDEHAGTRPAPTRQSGGS